MKLDSTNIISSITSLCGIIYTVIAESMIYQIIVGILTVIGLIFNISYTAWKWYIKSKKDGKITEDEIDGLFDDLKEIKNGKDDE